MEQVEQTATSFYMARQPIYDRNLKLAGYELLYRRSDQGLQGEIRKEEELNALSNILIEVGLDRLAGVQEAYINVPQGLLGSEALRLLPCKKVTLEILEDTEWTPEVEQQIMDLKAEGYRLALDDYTFEERHAPFLPLVEIVKIDVLGMSEATLRENLPKIRRANQTYLAEKVETHEMVELCQKLGFDLFQGYFFSKPNTIRGSGVPANYSLSMSLLSKLQNPDITMSELETVLAGNVGLCHKILRLVNCAANGLTRPVDTIKQALMFLGTARIRTLASLAVTTSMPGKPPELYNLAMVRARYCEVLARTAKFDSPEKHFTVGLLSVLDALTDLPMEEVLSELPLAVDVTSALSGEDFDAPCSRTLRHALSVEQGNWNAASECMENVPTETYIEAVEWAHQQELLLAA